MAVPDWVDPVAKASEIVGAVVGVLAFAHDVWPTRPAHPIAGPPRRWLRIAALMGAIALGSLLLQRTVRIPVAIGAGVAASVSVMLYVVQRRRGPLPLPAALRTLVDRQHEEARRHTYQFTVGTGVPPLPDIYVEQHAEAWEPHSGARTRLALADMLREQHAAVVIADPGVGKSTAIAKVLWEQCGWLRAARRHHSQPPYGPVIPIALPADLHGRASIADALAAEWERVTGEPPAPGMFESPPPFGRSWLVLLDGVDQVLDVTERQRVLDLLGSWPTGATRRLLITSRPLLGSEFGYLKDRAFFRLTKFDAAALEDFASRWVRFRSADPMRPAVVDAQTFLSCVHNAPLASLVRVPLIATITYLLLEVSVQPLPASRAKLYERYMLHLLSSRQAAPPPPAFAVHHAAGERAWEWLGANLRPLLEGTADQALTVGAPAVHDCAVSWIKSAAPDGMFDQVAGWDDGLDSLLTSTSLIVPDRGGLAFAHPSFTEYLASGPRSAGRLDVETWLADAQSPDSRSLALFTLARRCGTDGFALAEEVIALLLARGGVDACVAGEIIADGIPVSANIRLKVVDRLFGLLAADDLDTGGALRALALLAADPGVRSRLAVFADDATQPEWVRADVAEGLCGAELDRGIRLLRSVFAGSSDTWLRRRILLKLAELGAATDAERAEFEFTVAQSGPVSGGARAGEWFRQVAQSAANLPVQRLSAALALADRRDDLWRSLVAGLIVNGGVSADSRFQAARRLCSGVAGMEVLRQVAERQEPDVRIPVLAAMSSARDEWARQLLNEELYRNGAGLRARFPQLDAWREEVGERSYTQRSTLPPRDPYFTGREDVLDSIHAGLASGRPVCLTGIGGVGKTAIAVEYAHRHAAEYRVVLWGPAGDVDWLVTGVHYLMVLDGIDARFASRVNVDVLITARDAVRWEEDCVTIGVDVFSREDAERYLHSRLPRGITRSEANWLCRKLGDLPLALDQAAGYLAETGASVEDYLTQLAATGAISDPATDGRILVTLQSLRPEFLHLLCCCAMFAAAPIPMEVFRSSGLPASPLRDLLTDEVRFRRALRTMTRRSLLEVTQRSVIVPTVVRSVVRTSVASAGDPVGDARIMLAAAISDLGTPLFSELLPHLLELGGGDPRLAGITVRYLRLSGKPEEAARFARKVRDVEAE